MLVLYSVSEPRGSICVVAWLDDLNTLSIFNKWPARGLKKEILRST